MCIAYMFDLRSAIVNGQNVFCHTWSPHPPRQNGTKGDFVHKEMAQNCQHIDGISVLLWFPLPTWNEVRCLGRKHALEHF